MVAIVVVVVVAVIGNGGGAWFMFMVGCRVLYILDVMNPIQAGKGTASQHRSQTATTHLVNHSGPEQWQRLGSGR